MKRKLSAWGAAGFMICAAAWPAAASTVYSNTNDYGTIGAFGGTYYSHDTLTYVTGSTAYGETFTAPGGNLTDWSFTIGSGYVGNYIFEVAAWNPTTAKTTGPALYTSPVTSYQGGVFAPATFSGLNVPLTAGDAYIAFITIAGVTNPTADTTLALSKSDGGLGGQFEFLNSNGADPLTYSGAWSGPTQTRNFVGPLFSLQYSATFSNSATAVPEPADWTLIVGGLGALGLARLRRRT